jgi:myo-inositol 2-dehydrogenase/D-chiro-inositol 1-dehydrogenase
MTLGVGVIGTGMIGQDHIRRITRVLSGGTVVAVTDVDAARAEQVAAELPGAAVHPTAQDLIAAGHVDAVLIASWGPAHEEQVIAAIGAGKPVFCEKPLAPSKDACLRIIDAELAAGRRLVQVGFMRRYDAGYRAMKAVVDDGGIGAPLMMHCAHRNPSVPPYGFTTEMSITDSAVHEIDLVRWLFDEEVAAASVLKPRRTGKAAPGEHDPLIVLLEMASGILVDDEVFVNAAYGYDVRGEIVCESGTVALADADQVIVRAGNRHGGHVPADWRERFARAYDAELADWLTAAAQGTSAGPGSWDGYAAAAVTDSCLEALRTGRRVAVPLAERPGFYANPLKERAPGESRARPVHVPPRPADRPARAGRGPRLFPHRALPAGGLPAVLRPPAGGRGADCRLQEGPGRGRRAGLLGAAALPVVGP